jgi:pantoate--beta-alanine ligase
MLLFRSKNELKNFVKTNKGNKRSIALVPTMGALHAGHLSLVEWARKNADIVIASIFVNPLQFGANEDFSRYPRQEGEDAKLLESAGCDGLYLPTPEDMYGDGFSTSISMGEIGEILCGKFRPGHFNGVATVVAKLFLQTEADIAVFGRKDFQQLAVINKLVRELDIPIKIHGMPTMREESGLAMSSRNRYLDESEKRTASLIFQTLSQAAELIKNGADIEKTLADSQNHLKSNGFEKIDYLELRHCDSLEPLIDYQPSKSVLIIASRLGKTRLIDNLEF